MYDVAAAKERRARRGLNVPIAPTPDGPRKSMNQLGDQFKKSAFAGLDTVAGKDSLGGKLGDKFKADTKLGLCIERVPGGLCIDRVGKGFKSMGNAMAKEADKALVKQARIALSMVGTKMNTQLHDDAMPIQLHSLIDMLFGTMWPEVQKGVLDKLLLDKGLQFRDYRNQTNHAYSGPPTRCFQWSVATLLYAVNPFDRSFWGIVRSPLFLVIKLVRYPWTADCPACNQRECPACAQQDGEGGNGRAAASPQLGLCPRSLRSEQR